MSTRRGPKVEPHENPRIETPATIKIENEYFTIKTDNPITIPEEGLKYGEDYVENPEIKRTLQESLTEPVVVSSGTTENIGLKHLREERDKTTERWSKMGLLEGLDGNVSENCAQLFEAQTSFILSDEDLKVIESLAPKKKKAIQDLNQTELRMYQKIGILPDL